MEAVVRETRPGQSSPGDTTVIDARVKAASAGVWLRRTAFTTDRFWLPDRPQSVRAETDPLPSPAPPAAAVTALVVAGSGSPRTVSRPPARRQLPPPSRRADDRSLQNPNWRSVRTGPSPSVEDRYSVDAAMAARLQIVVTFATLLGILALLVLYILLRSLDR